MGNMAKYDSRVVCENMNQKNQPFFFFVVTFMYNGYLFLA